jgi:NADH-quinone oxidoreductase subunit A
MPIGYQAIFAFAVISAAFPLLALVAGRLLRPSAPNSVKSEAYECGVPSAKRARSRFSVRYYVVAMLFVIFDVETVLLFPWALRYRQLGWFGVGVAGIFLAFLVVGYIWIIRKRAIEWA